jgi:hypothetical protein
MDRWLKHERYRHLALAPDGWTDARGHLRPPTTLDPASPEAFALARDLLGQLLPCFTSRRVHVGLDEPWELPPDRIGDYLDWAARLRELPELDRYDVMMWGDLVTGNPDRIARLPNDMTICEWGYDDWYPFSDRVAVYEHAGVPAWVCPGTSSWLTILGRYTNMVGNNAAAAQAGKTHGAQGFLTTDWGDKGHLQSPVISEPGFAYAAAVSWCLDTNRDLDIAAALDLHSFADDARQLGTALVGLGDVHRAITPQFPNVSTLVLHLYYPQVQIGRSFTAGITVEELDHALQMLDTAVARVEQSRSTRADAELVRDELRTGAALVGLAARDARARLDAGDGRLESVPAAVRASLAEELRPLLARYRELWLARNRPGGLDDSAAWLENLLRCYETGTTNRRWGGW